MEWWKRLEARARSGGPTVPPARLGTEAMIRYLARAILLTAAAVCLAFAGGAAAQSSNSSASQYKYVDADGRVTYSDRPPPPTARVLDARRGGDGPPSSPLPFDLQQAASRYPVVLYSGNRCDPCDDARALLRGRGVPFTEKTVTSNEDVALFKQQSPDGTAPVVMVGTRKVVGFSQPNIASLLDDAGYPATSKLPRDYQYPVPTALSPTATTAAAAGPAPAPAAAPRAPAASTPATPAGPPGFRF
jgi:glutaredoxin